ncbi:MAG TPA: MarC family protein [Terriglobales bacterium]|nr:MarC family protein [Terriglobales bacterium]
MLLQLPMVADFLLVFTALFSIVNPIGTAFLFLEATKSRTLPQRNDLARKIATYSFMIMLCSIWIGAYVLKFFGISIAALRLAGGFVVCATAWQMLNGIDLSNHHEASTTDSDAGQDIAFVPLTMPMTTGPGTISVAIALGANRPIGDFQLARFAIASGAAVFLITCTILLCYRGAGRMVTHLGKSGVQTLSKLAAFLLLCVGMQIGLNGIQDFMGR